MSAQLASETIQKTQGYYAPRVGIVLGSGLGNFVDTLENKIIIPYEKIPGFPKPTVKGHAGCVTLGTLNEVPIICLQGRSHPYEGSHCFDTVKTYVRTLHLLGCTHFLATNASGSLHTDMPPGDLMLITDHINFQGMNVLVGPNDDDFGPRFLPVDDLYDLTIRKNLLQAAERCDIELHQGVYLAALGPCYETAAEIRAFRVLGADAVGMSTVPEVIVAHHCGMRVGAIATITNYATGLNTAPHDHNEVVRVASAASEKLVKVIQEWVKET